MTMRRLAGAGWAGLILAFYYRRAWRLLAAGPTSWDMHGFLDGGWRPPWPWAGEAALRAAHGVAGAGAVIGAAWLLGLIVLRLLRATPAGSCDRWLFQLAAGFASLAYLSLALSTGGWYRPVVVGPLTIALALAAAAHLGWSWLRVRAPEVSATRAVWREARREPLAWIVLLALGFGFIGALAPEKEYDALWYHLWLPKIWLERGHPVDVLTEFVSLYPLTWELLYGNAMCVGGPVAAKLLHFACLPLTAAAALRLARRFFDDVPRWAVAAVLVTTPTVVWESTTAYNDLAVAFYITLGVYGLLGHVQRPDAIPSRAWFRLAVLCLACAASLKHLGLVVVVLAAAALTARALFERRSLAAMAEPAILVTATLLVALPWYWRAWTASGNPFFPELYSIFGAGPVARWDAITDASLAAFKARFGLGRSIGTLLLLPWNLTHHSAAFAGTIGPLFLLALPGLIAAIIGSSRRVGAAAARSAGRFHAVATAWVAVLVVGYVAVWASPLSSLQLRFLVPVVPLMSVLCALGLSRLRGWVAPGHAGAAALAGLLVLNLPPFTPLHEGDRHGWRGWLAHTTRGLPIGVVVGRESEDLYLRRQVPTYAAWQHLASRDGGLPARVLEVGGGDNYYATQAKLPADATIARDTWECGPGAGATVMEALRSLSITHVVFEKTELEGMSRQGAVLATPSFQRDYLVLDYQDERALVYRVAPTASSARQRSFLPH